MQYSELSVLDQQVVLFNEYLLLLDEAVHDATSIDSFILDTDKEEILKLIHSLIYKTCECGKCLDIARLDQPEVKQKLHAFMQQAQENCTKQSY